MEIVASLRVVDEVFVEECLEQKRDYIVEHGADVLVMGDDWAGKFDGSRATSARSSTCPARRRCRPPRSSSTSPPWAPEAGAGPGGQAREASSFLRARQSSYRGSRPCSRACDRVGAAASLGDSSGSRPSGKARPSSGSSGWMPCSRVGA